MISTVYIAKNVYGGEGLGRLGDGRVVFVPGAWAGEQVRAEIVEEKKNYVKARLVEVVEKSSDRVPVRYELPGMVYEGLSFAAENAAKESQLLDFLTRARFDSPAIQPFDASTLNPYNYRNKVVYHFARQNDAWVLGYRKEPSHEIVDITSDPLARPEINAKLPEIRRSLMMLLNSGPLAIRQETARKENLTIRWTARSGVQWWVGNPPKDLVLRETTGKRDFLVPADGFYQVNPTVHEALLKAVLEDYRKGAATSPDILDLYCGVGVFGLSLLAVAPAGARLVGVESGRQAIDIAKRNAAAFSSSDHVTRFYSEQVERNLHRLPLNPQTTVIVDPPRDGLPLNVAKFLDASRAGRILYVSCDPATLVRDLKFFVRDFKIEAVRWFNMFPRTARFETLVTLAK